jgi:hypothetical protein
MITKHQCEPIKETPWKDKIKECCDQEDPDHPKGCDCCYDTWTDELKEVNTKFSEADEEAKHMLMELNYISERRDKLKIWYDELTKANDLSQYICDHLEVMQDQIDKVAKNTSYAVQAIQILYCMIRDFYMQIDLIKTKYDEIYTCIRCLNDPVLVPGQGILKCLEEYGKKLNIVIATRDELLKMVMMAIYTAYRINKNLAQEYGLYMVIGEWRITFNCDENCGGASVSPSDYKTQSSGIQTSYEKEQEKKKKCKLAPRLQFPICNDPYYGEIKDKYENDKGKASELAKDLIDLNKKKESLMACKQSLEAAIREVDPKIRCN